MVDETGKRTGRPRKEPANRKRNIQTVRVRDALKERLAAVAAARQRSISEEMEARIEESFRIDDEFGTGPRRDILHMIALSMKFAETLTGHSDYASQEDFASVRTALMGVLNHFENLPAIRWASPQALKAAERIGQAAADVQNLAALKEAGISRDITPSEAESVQIAAQRASAAPRGKSMGERDREFALAALDELARNHDLGMGGVILDLFQLQEKQKQKATIEQDTSTPAKAEW